ncbi:anther-specific protein BCP1-like [Durio zibethinus]|uniref:Anther-specific protein BCP1-like n=1 Tax=Durio zibethinus TaxID=66656 RepID=A0A6P6BEY7_DURZI|nr:anther-specific protein BCP1-like [Durio zibethinus]
MARQVVVLALVLIALVGLVSADTPASANATPKSSSTNASSPSSQGGTEAAAALADDDAIGNTDEADAPSNSTGGDASLAVEGPIGSEDAANSAAGTAQPPSSGATALGFSAVAGAAAIAGYFVF